MNCTTVFILGWLTSAIYFHIIVNIRTSHIMDGIWLDDLWESFSSNMLWLYPQSLLCIYKHLSITKIINSTLLNNSANAVPCIWTLPRYNIEILAILFMYWCLPFFFFPCPSFIHLTICISLGCSQNNYACFSKLLGIFATINILLEKI